MAKGFFPRRRALRLTVPQAAANVTRCRASGDSSLRRESRECNEANLSAKSEQAETHARVPRANEDPRGAERAEAAAGQGAAAPGRLTPGERGRERFPRAARVLKAADFSRALRAGRRLSSGPFVLHVAAAERGDVRLGLNVSRRAGTAVVRNRIKRSLREHFRRHRNSFPPGTVLIVVVTRDLSALTGVTLRRAVAEAFRAAVAAGPAGGRREGAG